MSNHNLEVYLSSLKLLHPNSTTNQNTTKITHIEQFIAEQTSHNDKDQTKVESKDIKDIIFHTYGEDENWLTSSHLQHTQHEYSWRRTDFRNDRQGDIYLPGFTSTVGSTNLKPKYRRSLPNSRPRRFSC